MAKILGKASVKMGKLIPVENQNKKFNENDKYLSLHVEDEDGNNERCLLFTDIEISDMENIEIPFSNKMKLGRIYKARIDNKDTYLLRVITNTNMNKVLKLSVSQLKLSEERSKRNPEDLPKRSWIKKILGI